ncbi:MAG: LLM class oxidoreductase [Pseudomonadota bacterium]
MVNDWGFADINTAYRDVFQPNRMTVGVVAPIETYATRAEPTMARHLERAHLADELGFAAIWVRDVPFNVPSFGDAGQLYDPFVYLGLLAGLTRRIALGAASIIQPLPHPAHEAKAAASEDALSGWRLLLGVASGDRPEEYPALNAPFAARGARFRDAVAYLREMDRERPQFENDLGAVGGGVDMLPKPTGGRLPLLITGGAQQSPDWIAENGDGWMTYPRGGAAQGRMIADYRARILKAGAPDKPVMQPLYVDYLSDADAPPRPLHLGFQSGARHLKAYLRELEAIGVNHVALNLRFNQDDVETTLKRLANEILPDFST